MRAVGVRACCGRACVLWAFERALEKCTLVGASLYRLVYLCVRASKFNFMRCASVSDHVCTCGSADAHMSLLD